MAKKRLIFTLLYNDGGFMLSRNFRLQRAGDIKWLKTNYNFKRIAFSIDELIILDVSRNERNIDRFCEHIKAISQQCFIPVAAGGGIRHLAQAKQLINSGADKLVVNTILQQDPSLVKDLVKIYGSQCIIASVDIKKQTDGLACFINNGTQKTDLSFLQYIQQITALGVGEIYLNSIDKDGTGQGYLFELIETIKDQVQVPVIMAGGAGNWNHLLEGIQHQMTSAVATANLFNFVGDGFPNARKQLLSSRINLAQWEAQGIENLKNSISSQEKLG